MEFDKDTMVIVRATLARILSMWRFVIGFMIVFGLGACNQVFGIPDVAAAGSTKDASIGDAASSPEFLSCVGLPRTCGTSGNDSCCNSPEVPGGSYYRSYDLAGDGLSGNMDYPATVSKFRLDKYEVTVGRFRAFLNARMGTQSSPPLPGAGAHPHISGSGWDLSWNNYLVADTAMLMAAAKCHQTYMTLTDIPTGNEHRPMNCITWAEAMAFCIWDGGYLPTEAEWNYAAAGGDQQRAYPWSNPPASLTIDSSYASYSCAGDGMPGCAMTDLVEVGTKPAGDGRWGQSDLAGNAWEWTLDWYTDYLNPCIDCDNLITGGLRALRGGYFDFYSDARILRTGVRGYDIGINDRSYAIGFRCARNAL